MKSASVPQQQNCSDCGLFALAFAERLAAAAVAGWSLAEQPAVPDTFSLQQAVEQATASATQEAVSMMRGGIRKLIDERSNKN